MGGNCGVLNVMWIKICGITRIEDAQAAAAAGAEAVGLNFYPGSRRFVHPDEAKEIAEAVPPSLDVVGVFVNSSVQDVIGIARRAQLTAVQFHGDETAESVAVFQEACPEVAVVRAFRLRTDALEQVIKSIHELRQSSVVLAAVLVDAFVADAYGGTGHMIAADLFGQFRKSLNRLANASDNSESDQSRVRPTRVILAGGLTPETVASAAAAAQPWGVDTASGVETAPGLKSSEKILRFVKAVRKAEPVESTDRL